MAVRIWIALSTLFVASGWILSALHQLNRAGYGAVFAVSMMLWIALRSPGRIDWNGAARLVRKQVRRFRRPAPFLFLVLATMSLAAVLIYMPHNGDSNSYRTPRVLHWLWAEQWHWIRTFDDRLNVTGSNFEWLTAPLILFARTERWIALINWFSFLLLPGLIFSVFVRLGVGKRVAWWWMWLVSTGWCFVLQAGTITNDSVAAVYALASVSLAFRARERSSTCDWWLSMLAMALMTGVKATNIPLALLWLLPAAAAYRTAFRRPILTVAMALLALLISFIPHAIANLQHDRTWIGMVKDTTWGVELHSPFWAVLGNAFCLTVQNLMPPYFPWADRWNAAMEHFVTTPLGENFRSFERFGTLSNGMHGVSESNAGVGLAVCCVLVLSIVLAWWHGRRSVGRPEGKEAWLAKSLRVLPWFLLIPFMAKVGTYENARHLIPYYSFLFPIFIARSGHFILVRKGWWRGLALLSIASAIILIGISRNRPLFPVQTILRSFSGDPSDSGFISKAAFAYGVRSKTDQLRGYFNQFLPLDEKVVGFSGTLGLSEVGLWMPFGMREVRSVLPDDDRTLLDSQKIRYLVIEDPVLEIKQRTIEDWIKEYRASVVTVFPYKNVANRPPINIYLVRLEQ